MRRSIRWELPLSYAAIALLATVALGVVLLFILRGYYGQQEQAYLRDSALVFSQALAPTLGQDLPAESLRDQVISLSFLSQMRVRLLDKDGALLADSNTPGQFDVSLPAVREAEVLVQKEGVNLDPDNRVYIPASPSKVVTTTGTLPSLFLFQSFQPNPYSRTVTRAMPSSTGGSIVTMKMGSVLTDRRSGKAVQSPIYDDRSNLLGYVQLSEGPAYGQEIMTSVARGWALAGLVAVVLAAAVGWLASRRISAPLLALTGITASMAAGNLAARADVRRKDEFGTLAASFNAMANQVEDTVVTLRRFVSDAAHELNTPLATLRANLEMMRDDMAAMDGVPEGGAPENGGQPGIMATSEARLARAQAQVERLEVLTQGMLNLSRIEAGTNQETFGPVSLTALARSMGELYASCAEQAGLGFELFLPETAVIVQGNETQLRQALANLLDNAIKFTPEGGQVMLGLDHTEQAARLWVRDTGIGIPEEDLPHLFQRFHRGRNTEGYSGSGLGLAIVRAIADHYGGSVSAEAVGHGTRISLELPC
jgi:signal transduction histidine kinase